MPFYTKYGEFVNCFTAHQRNINQSINQS